MTERKRILVTGGRGFVGVNLIRALKAQYSVVAFDNMVRPSPTGWKEGSGEMIVGDIRNLGELTSAMRNVSCVVHLAAYGSVIESVTDPLTNFEINARGTLNVLEAAVKSGVPKVIFASTGGALIGDVSPPVDEESVPRPISPYGASKLCGEGYCHAFAKSYEIEAICLRFGNVYGPHSAHKKGAVTTFIKQILRGQPIVIYGDGAASRDYIHVSDLCAGISAAIERPQAGAAVYHLASGQETTVRDLAWALRQIAGVPQHPIDYKPARRGEVLRNFANYEKASRELGFAPHMGLEDGLKATWEWFSTHSSSILDVVTTDS